MSERFKKTFPDHPGLLKRVREAINKAQNAKKKIWETDTAYDYLPKSSQQIVDDMVEGTQDGIKAATDMEWAMAANEEGVDPDTIERMWQRVEQQPTPVRDSIIESYSSKIH